MERGCQQKDSPSGASPCSVASSSAVYALSWWLARPEHELCPAELQAGCGGAGGTRMITSRTVTEAARTYPPQLSPTPATLAVGGTVIVLAPPLHPH